MINTNNMSYKKIAPNIFLPETSTPEPLYLDRLEAELAALQAQSEMQEPTEQELLIFARSAHPYYMQKTNYSNRVSELEDLINTLKAL